MGKVILKYRNLFLLGVLVATLVVSYYVNQDRLLHDVQAVSVPVSSVTSPPATPLEGSRRTRDETALADMAALRTMVDSPSLTDALRADAAARLTALVDAREKQQALEDALSLSGIAPCVAVVSPGCVTVATERTSLTEQETALVLSLACAHTGVEPSGVRLICAEE